MVDDILIPQHVKISNLQFCGVTYAKMTVLIYHLINFWICPTNIFAFIMSLKPRGSLSQQPTLLEIECQSRYVIVCWYPVTAVQHTPVKDDRMIAI